jgi:hypothetical protein
LPRKLRSEIHDKDQAPDAKSVGCALYLLELISVEPALCSQRAVSVQWLAKSIPDGPERTLLDAINKVGVRGQGRSFTYRSDSEKIFGISSRLLVPV